MRLCPDCNNEILPYLKTGEFKQVVKDKFITYQFHYCLFCRTVFYEEQSALNFKPLVYKEKKDGPNENDTNNGSTNSGGAKKRVQPGRQHGKSSGAKVATGKDSSRS